MDDSVAPNLSVDMEELNQTSLLNQNVSFNSSSLEISRPSVEVDRNSVAPSLPNLSFSLTDAELHQLKKNTNTAAAVRSSRGVLTEMSLNEQNRMETTLEEQSTVEDSVLSIEDTMDEAQDEQTATPADIVTPVHEYFKKELLELGRRCWSSSVQAQHYTKGCYWSPDGTCLLVPVHQDGMHVMELPLDLYGATNIAPQRGLTKLNSAVHVPEGGTVYDCVWYPQMNSQQPETCCWLATRQHEPIHMWDAFDGNLRCSYVGYDEVDEVVAAISLAFSHDAEKIYAGYKRSIKIFDTSRPGRIYDEYPVKFAISCIAQTTDHPNTLTCGNWHGYIQHFDLRCSPKQGPLFTLGGHQAGITQLKYSPSGSGDWHLFSGARKCSKLLQWDMRNYKKPLREYKRQVESNQRIQFDLNSNQSWLGSGDTRGMVNFWQLEANGEPEPTFALPIHKDCCNGLSFHPSLPILATSSGQYHFVNNDGHMNETLLSEMEGEKGEKAGQHEVKEVWYENAVLLLWCGQSQ